MKNLLHMIELIGLRENLPINLHQNECSPKQYLFDNERSLSIWDKFSFSFILDWKN